jgi:hypothetical protein
LRLAPIHNAARIAGFNGAETAMARTSIAQNHERQTAARKTFTAIGTFSADTNGVEFFFG